VRERKRLEGFVGSRCGFPGGNGDAMGM